MWVAQQMGHADWAMIRKVYGRWIPEVDPTAGQRITALLAGDRGDRPVTKPGPNETNPDQEAGTSKPPQPPVSKGSEVVLDGLGKKPENGGNGGGVATRNKPHYIRDFRAVRIRAGTCGGPAIPVVAAAHPTGSGQGQTARRQVTVRSRFPEPNQRPLPITECGARGDWSRALGRRRQPSGLGASFSFSFGDGGQVSTLSG